MSVRVQFTQDYTNVKQQATEYSEGDVETLSDTDAANMIARGVAVAVPADVKGCSVKAQAMTATTAGAAVDMDGAAYPTRMDVSIGALSGTCAVQAQESDDGSTGWTNVGTAVTGVADTFSQVEIARTKQYVRANVTIGGGSPSTTLSVVFHAPAEV